MRYKTIARESYWTVPMPTASAPPGDGPEHPVQLYAMKKYVKPGSTLLDIGCGSPATYQAILNEKLDIK